MSRRGSRRAPRLAPPRRRCKCEPDLVSDVLRNFVRVAHGHAGGVTSIQRAGSFANANVHFHTLVPEGVWYERADGTVAFHALPPPTDQDVVALTTRIVRRVARLHRTRDADADATDPPELDDLAHAQAEAVQLARVTRMPSPLRASIRRRAALVDGFSLQADTVVDAGDRTGLERLSRYLLRRLVSADRLTRLADGRVEYTFKWPDPTGRTSWGTDGPTWLRRLATLVPPPRSHTTRFHGVFGPAHRWRARIVPAPRIDDGAPACETPTPRIRRAYRLDGAQLLRRVFGDDVTRCPRCDDHLRVLAFLTDPAVTTAIVDHLGIRSDRPRLAPARAPPEPAQAEFDLGC